MSFQAVSVKEKHLLSWEIVSSLIFFPYRIDSVVMLSVVAPLFNRKSGSFSVLSRTSDSPVRWPPQNKLSSLHLQLSGLKGNVPVMSGPLWDPYFGGLCRDQVNRHIYIVKGGCVFKPGNCFRFRILCSA